MTPGEQRTLSSVRAELARLVRYDDESLVHDAWIRQRYQGGYAELYAPARKEAVATAWHEAGHAVAALSVGARFSSASIRAGGSSSGRVHSITGGGTEGFVIAAGGQVAEGLRGWTLPSSRAEALTWLASWREDGGDARRFRAGLAGTPFARDEAAAWQHCVDKLTPLRLQIRDLARGLLVWPRHLPYAVAAELAGFAAAASAAAGRSLPSGRACPGCQGTWDDYLGNSAPGGNYSHVSPGQHVRNYHRMRSFHALAQEMSPCWCCKSTARA
jgi:Peptidase M50B-like